jgi:hypothetical protein
MLEGFDLGNHRRDLPCYHSFKSHLMERGFLVYPSEFECVYSDHPMVDIAAKMGSFYWAFEYKSASDSVSRGVDQIRCYQKWFDYTVLVSERIFDHRNSQNYWSLRNLGAGLWFYDPHENKCMVRCNPVIQRPPRHNRASVVRRFSDLCRARRFPTQISDSICQIDLRVFVS